MAEKEPVAYVCVTGIDHTKGRNERGESYTGNPKSLPWLLEQGHVVAEGSTEHKQLQAQLSAEEEN
jgi:hypothetical protein